MPPDTYFIFIESECCLGIGNPLYVVDFRTGVSFGAIVFLESIIGREKYVPFFIDNRKYRPTFDVVLLVIPIGGKAYTKVMRLRYYAVLIGV